MLAANSPRKWFIIRDAVSSSKRSTLYSHSSVTARPPVGNHQRDDVVFTTSIVDDVLTLHSQNIVAIGWIGPVVSVEKGIEQHRAWAQSLNHPVERGILVIQCLQDYFAHARPISRGTSDFPEKLIRKATVLIIMPAGVEFLQPDGSLCPVPTMMSVCSV